MADHCSFHRPDSRSDLYLQGVTDFISVLDAERSLATSEDALALSQEAISLHAVALCKSLGGG